MRNETFTKPTLQDWQEKAEESLKGLPIEKLSTATYEGIKLKPLYSREDLPVDIENKEGEMWDFRRGYTSSGYIEDEWSIAQKLTMTSAEELRSQLLTDLNKGQSAVAFNPDEFKPSEVAEIVADLEAFPLSVMTENSLLSLYKAIGQKNWQGYIGKDPLTTLFQSKPGYDDDWMEAIILAHENSPSLKTVLTCTSVYHEKGANAIQELAIAIASAVSHIERLLDKGLPLENIVDKFVFHFAIGANFFMEISKLRAAKILWYKTLEAYGLSSEQMNMTISAQTSSYTKTLYDPYVNLLRAGNEAFAAILGGINYLHVSPFDEPKETSSSFANRIARNTQLILKEEVHLTKVVDPAGGSYYIETLTNQLADQAWGMFLDIEEKGGIETVIKSGWLQEQIDKVHKKRLTDTYTRKQSIVGTNKYANLDETPIQKEGRLGNRLSIPYEKLRCRVEALKAKGVDIRVGLLCLGELKQYKARMDFSAGFLAPGGIVPYVMTISKTVDLYEQLKRERLSHYIICGANDQYDEELLDTVKAVNDQSDKPKLFLAGLPSADEQNLWKQAGIIEFLHVKSDCFHILSTIVNDWEVEEK